MWIRIQGIDDQNFVASMKDVQATGEASSLQKRTLIIFTHMIRIRIHSADLDPADQIIYRAIRIRIHNTAF
jgi:hypothetical protein